MKKIFLIFSIIFCILITAVYVVNLNSSETKDISFVSPVPDFLSIKENKQVSVLNLWLPVLGAFIKGDIKSPQITAKSALLFDIDKNKVLYEKNPKEKLPMASITKIMTAIISLENPKKDDKYFVKKEYLVGENTMGLEVNEVLGLKDLLYGLLLPSGNDAAETLAGNYPKGRDAFIKAMNDKAIALGLEDTNFTNPSGLEGDGDQHTTAYDLVVITKYALDNFKEFREIVKTYEHNINAKVNLHKSYYLLNDTNLITSYPGVKGVKTGYTPEAGYCLVTYLDYKGNRIIGVILGSENRRQEMKDLLDYSLNLIGVEPPPHS